jgi:probable rRNA maturation factor
MNDEAHNIPRLIIDNQVSDFDPHTLRVEHAFLATEKHLNTLLDITLIFLPIDLMFNMNNQLRNKPSPTDVLSLPLNCNTGEIFICPEFILKQGYDNNRVIHLWVHGLLHIAGYTHDNDDDFKIMSDHEIRILSELGIENPYV